MGRSGDKRLHECGYRMLFPVTCHRFPVTFVSVILHLIELPLPALCRTIGGFMDQQDNPSGATGERSLPAKINLHFDLHTPSKEPGPLLIALHGYGSNKR